MTRNYDLLTMRIYDINRVLYPFLQGWYLPSSIAGIYHFVIVFKVGKKEVIHNFFFIKIEESIRYLEWVRENYGNIYFIDIRGNLDQHVCKILFKENINANIPDTIF